MIDDRTKTISYFAFDSLELKQIFAKLLKISGIWPKTAFTIAHIPPAQLQQAVDDFDIGFVQSIPGIGPKTAKKIIIELKDSLKSDDVAKLQIDKTLLKSITTMLKNFGYQSQQISAKLSQCPIELKQENLQDVVTWLVKKM
jgi:Holliday junction DNA helicase RuvA